MGKQLCSPACHYVIGLKIGHCTLSCRMQLTQHGDQVSLLMDNQPQKLERRGPWQSKTMQRPTVLSAIPMEKTPEPDLWQRCYETHTDSEAMHAVNQNLQPLGSFREENNVIDVAQERYTAARAQHQLPCRSFADAGHQRKC